MKRYQKGFEVVVPKQMRLSSKVDVDILKRYETGF